MRFILTIFILTTHLLMAQTPVKYVALGDSYTICTGAEERQSWPLLLSQHLKKSNINIELIANPAQNGWTTKDLIDKELPVLDKSSATFVTLLIGVNDWVQGVKEADFRTNLIHIIKHIQAQLPDKRKLLLITIPDFGVTPTGAKYSNGRDIAAGIRSFNRIIEEEARKHQLTVVDLFEISKQMGKYPSLIAADGLHPSAKEYAIWETIIYPAAYELLKK
jgi:lysophospholipase L1-like esterase